jgi:hypothetical protein
MWIRIRSALVSAFTAGLVVASLAGCQAAPPPADTASPSADQSSDAAATDTEVTNDPALSKQICGKAPASVVKSTLGFTVTEPQESFDETEIECTYRSVGNGNSLVVKFRTGQDAASFARNRRDADSTGMPTTDVDGVGDQAYATAEEFDALVSNTLVARKGSVQMSVTAPATIEQEKAFVKAVFAAL